MKTKDQKFCTIEIAKKEYLVLRIEAPVKTRDLRDQLKRSITVVAGVPVLDVALRRKGGEEIVN